MVDYTDHDVWHVTVQGSIDVEAPTQEEAITRAQALFIAGEGTLAFSATLYVAKIEVTG